MVRDVVFTTKDVYLASGSKSERRTIQRNIINIGFKGGEMTHSPTWTSKHIVNGINPMFGLGVGEYGSNWGIEWKMI